MNTVLLKRHITQFLAIWFLAWTGFAHAGLERWSGDGPEDGYIRTISAADVGATGVVNTLYASTWGGGIVRSTWSNTNGWSTFVQDNAGLTNLRIWVLTQSGATLYAATDGAGVWTATVPANNTLPLTWTQMSTSGLNCGFARSVSVVNSQVYVGTACSGASSGIYRWTGAAWTRAGTAASLPNGVRVANISSVPGIALTACSASPNNCLYIGTSTGIYFNTDGTSTLTAWTPLGTQPAGADTQSNLQTVRTQLNGTTLYLQATINGGGVQQTTVQASGIAGDFTTVGGWVAPAGQPNLHVSGGLSGDPVNNDQFWVSYQGYGGYRGIGAAGFGTPPFRTAYVPGTDYLPQLRGIFRPRDGAALEPNGGGNMLVARTVEGVYWLNVPTGQWNQIPFSDNTTRTIVGVMNDVYIDPSNPKKIIFATAGSVYVSANSGNQAAKQTLPGGGEIGRNARNVIAADQTSLNGPNFYVSTNSTGIFKAYCADCSWRTSNNGLPNLAGLTAGILADPNDTTSPQTLFAYTDRRYPGETIGRGVWTSIDGANNWGDFSGTGTTGLGNVGGSGDIREKHVTAAAIASDGTMVIGTGATLNNGGKVLKSATGSASWSLLYTLPTVASNSSRVSSIAVDGANVYVGVVVNDGFGVANATSTGVYAGTTASCCTKITNFPSGVKPSTITVTNNGGTKTLWVGATDDSTGGIYKSTDNGVTWLTTNIRLANKDINNFAVVNSGSTQTVTGAGSIGGGFFFRSVQNGPDFNNDGRADILWRAETGAVAGQNYMWLMDGLSLNVSTPLPGVATPWQVAGHGDFNGDGFTDVLWRHSGTGEIYLWTMNGSTVMDARSIGIVATNWQIAGLGDLNGDGKSDILWRESITGEIYLWTMNGTTLASSGSIGIVGTNWKIAGLGDLNGDGKSDILWRDCGNAACTAGTGEVYRWLMDGFTATSTGSIGVVATSWQIAGLGDLNGDGKSDILWRDSAGQNYAWLMNGTTISSAGFLPTVPTPTTWQIAGVSDHNGDYISDVLWRNTATGENYIWQMQGLTVRSVCGSLGCQSGYLPSIPVTDWQATR